MWGSIGAVGGRHPGPSGRSPLRIGVVGAGFIGAVHARAAQRAGARIVGVAASTPANSEAAAAQLGADRAFADGETLVASPDIDVVHVCTPNQLHAPLSELALAAGKHVICEKPLALDVQTAKHLQASARREGAIATVPFVYRFYPLVREARARVANGFGPVRLIHGTYLQDWLSTEEDDNWRVDPAFAGPSRAFADIGSHWCDLVEFVTGDRLAAVCAELVTALPERRFGGEHVHAFGSGAHPGGSPRSVTTEDLATVMFRTVAGVAGSVVISQVSPGRKNRLFFEIAGADATVAFDQEQPETLWVGRRHGTEVVHRDAAHLDPAAAAYVTVPPGHPQGYQDCFDAFVSDSYRAIEAGSVDAVDGLPSFADGVRAALITETVLRSAATHSWQDIDAASEPKPKEATA